jgi:hypothetical protein
MGDRERSLLEGRERERERELKVLFFMFYDLFLT